VILVDANLLLYAYDADSRQHEAARQWLEAALSGRDMVRFTWTTIWAFIRIATNARVFAQPLSSAEAHAAVAAWLDQPNAGVLDPAERHLVILGLLLEEGQATGNLVMDAALAAIALEHGATLMTTDRDFARFPGLEWRNPIAVASHVR
jgi:toxin-antitoxin system PIN domain toxin